MTRFLILLVGWASVAVRAADLAFSEPANVTPMPQWAVGTANRSPDLDVLPGFQKPPPGFGTVPFFWWLGDPLAKERLAWELEQMAGMGVSGYQINYAHSDKGGRSYGLTYPSEPALFSEAWWSLTGWFMQEAKKQGAGISLSDYTLGFGQGWCVDEILREHPEVTGMKLVMGKDGKVTPERVPWSLNPMHPQSGQWYADKFFGQFEQRFPGEGGRGLNFFFSDELGFGVSGPLWSEDFAGEFQKRKGYDLTPELPALFKDLGPRTPKIRLDYSDVLVALSEEGFFKPVFDWHQQRGMIMGCDHGGRGRNVVEFGDYFRTQRWNQGPGSDQPALGKNLIKAKVAASIAHLYQRPRVWLEGYYGSGWGTSSADLVEATFANYALGYNLLGIHGMYYSTHGGWWEWAPPDNTFRMPYWPHLRGFMDCVQRLSYLLSQGDHRCDVAILYPVAPMEAGLDGQAAVQVAFSAGEQLYGEGVDFDFMDFESLARAKVVGKELHVSGEIYRVLVLPAMKAVRWSTMQQAAEFARAGGIVVALGALPEASDRVGRDDPELDALVEQTFGRSGASAERGQLEPQEAAASREAATPRTDGKGQPSARVFESAAQLVNLITNAFPRDYVGPGFVQHRRVGPRDLYALYGAAQGAECFFRATGKVELWDAWTGTTRPLAVTSQDTNGTKLKLPLTAKEFQLIVFSPGHPEFAAPTTAQAAIVVPLDGDWEFELQPTLDNRFGDFHWPPTATKLSAEVRQLWYCEGDQTNGPWRKVTCSFGPQFLLSTNLAPAGEARAYEFSWRWGMESDPGHQGYHGLKAELADDFLAVGRARTNAKHLPNVVSYDDAGAAYFSTAIVAPRDLTAHALMGAIKPVQIRLNGEVVTGTTLHLKAGANPLVLQYAKPGRTYFVVSRTAPSQPEAGSEDAFSPAASWIWYPGEKLAADRWFRREFELTAVSAPARLRITCDNSYAVTINGTHIGRGARWQEVQEFDVTQALRPGRNEIVVSAHNDGSDGGLIAELVAGPTRVATDASWRAAKTETGETVNAERIASFAGSLWYEHQHGPPRLAKPAANDSVRQPEIKASPLAMSWWKNPEILPFDVRADEPAPVGWYRFLSPPGLRGVSLNARGKVQVWANGQPLRSAGGGQFTVGQPSAQPVTVRLRIEQERGCYGGAAFEEPIRLDCGPGQLAAGDWSRNEGLLSYSGGAWYRKSVTIPAANDRRVLLQLGDVVASAELHVNGQVAGIRVSPPWTLDITPFVRPGENRLEILVRNTLANHYTTVPTRYRGALVSGLLGPVALELK